MNNSKRRFEFVDTRRKSQNSRPPSAVQSYVRNVFLTFVNTDKFLSLPFQRKRSNIVPRILFSSLLSSITTPEDDKDPGIKVGLAFLSLREGTNRRGLYPLAKLSHTVVRLLF